MKTFLSIEKLADAFVGTEWVVAFKIKKCIDSNIRYTASNRFRLISCANTSFDYVDKILYLGDSSDNTIVLIKNFYFQHLEKAILEYNESKNKPQFTKTILFRYSGGSNPNEYRRVGVIEETSTSIKGIDLDAGGYRNFLKKKIIGKINEVKE